MNMLKNVLLLFISAFLAVAGLELFLRTGLYEIPALSDKSSIAGARSGDKTKAEGGLKILVLGDSFMVFGERNFGHALNEQMMAKRSGTDVQIVNLGLSGIGIDKYEQIYRVRGQDDRPDIVLVGIFIGNDLYDLYKSNRSSFAALKHELASRFRVYWLLLDAYTRIRYSKENLDNLYQQYRPGLPRELQNDAARQVNPFLLELAALYPDYFMDNLGARGPYIEGSLALAEQYLAAMHKRAASQGARLIAVLIPDALQVDVRYRGFYEELGFNMNAEFHNSRALQDTLIAICNKNGIEHLDLLSHYRSSERDSLYLETDTHWSEKGTLRSAEITSGYLVDAARRH